jgi:hypothetical protein
MLCQLPVQPDLRTHTGHIFTKLDVNMRKAAVRRATELGLLQTRGTRARITKPVTSNGDVRSPCRFLTS